MSMVAGKCSHASSRQGGGVSSATTGPIPMLRNELRHCLSIIIGNALIQ